LSSALECAKNNTLQPLVHEGCAPLPYNMKSTGLSVLYVGTLSNEHLLHSELKNSLSIILWSLLWKMLC